MRRASPRNEVYTPQAPTKNECIWTIGNKTGQPGQQVAMTLQTSIK